MFQLNSKGYNIKSLLSFIKVMATLFVTSSGDSFEINTSTANIGRENCQITISDDSISRNHAQIAQTQDGNFCITDLGSSNGTLLNGKKLKEKTYYKLQTGDELTFGDITTKFQSESSELNDFDNSQSIIKQRSSQAQIINQSDNLVYAGFWQRFFALFIDGIILWLAALLFGGASTFISFLLKEKEVALFMNIILIPLNIITYWLYHALFESSEAQATIGKRAMSLKVVNLEGERISFLRATGRYFASWLSSFILLIGYLMQPFTKRKQTLHDLMAGTLVVKN